MHSWWDCPTRQAAGIALDTELYSMKYANSQFFGVFIVALCVLVTKSMRGREKYESNSTDDVRECSNPMPDSLNPGTNQVDMV